MRRQWQINWHDSGREPCVAPNPAYPEGVDVDISAGALTHCRAALPYPARRCGAYIIRCLQCGFRGAVTTAGRPDDPRSVTVRCKEEEA